MASGLDRLSAGLADGSAGGVKVTTRRGEPWITVPKLDKLDEPTGLEALKDEVVRRWGVLDLLDVLKNADFATGFTDEFSSVAAYERIDRDALQRRLLLALFALGTNMGIRAIVATGEHVSPKPRCGTSVSTSSPSTTCGPLSPNWSTPPSRPATPPGGAAGPRARATARNSGPGRRTS
ncbi:Tn3 family transposase [Streptomyces mirabilis]|uniref:Tn3 family transposase n=1 Tax=Streptomyces mirabilis TaxID=68239 RepID=UPI00365300EC